jgi:hypothetical protein
MAEAPDSTTTAPPRRLAAEAEGDPPGRIHTWPYLARLELIATLVILVLTTVWSITIDAPLEEPANPSRTPNPSKAPWYFLGLQEMLVYFDPWMAGVVMPSLIIVGLMVIPYVDINPRGNGYFGVKERKFAVGTFLFGFLVLWVSLIVVGVFLRGPGWYLFWPGEYWDVHKTVAITNVDLPYLFGFRDYLASAIFGLSLIVGYFVVGYILFYLWVRGRPANDRWSAFPGGGREILQKWGPVRFGITGFLLLAMVGVLIKMSLRHAFNIKYILVTPWLNI